MNWLVFMHRDDICDVPQPSQETNRQLAEAKEEAVNGWKTVELEKQAMQLLLERQVNQAYQTWIL